jgi:hypothetical protein
VRCEYCNVLTNDHSDRSAQDLNENHLQQYSILTDKGEIMEIISTFFNAGKTKNLAPLGAIQLDDSRFSSYSDVPPLDLKDYATTLALQQLRFVSISDYEYEIKNTRVDLFDNCAITTFTVKQTGMVVDNYSFRGQHMSMESRGTFVLVKSQKWKIAHIHLSKIT